MHDSAWRTRRLASGHPSAPTRPGMENDYAAAGVGHFMVDGPSLHGDTALGRPVGDSDVVAFGRDLQVSYRVWSPKSGYPGPRRVPRLPHLRPPHRSEARPRHRPQRAVRRQGALRSGARRSGRRRPRRRFRRRRPAAAAGRIRAHRPPRTRRSPRSTPSCSATGGTRDRCGWSGCCGRCPRRVCGRHAERRRRRGFRRLVPSNYRPALGVPARTGRCGPASRWPTWCSSTPRSSTPR